MGLRNGKTIELAMKMYNYIKNIPEGMLFGIKREKNAIMVTMQEVIPIELIEHKIKVLEKLKKEFPNSEELKIKIITLKELLEELKK